MFEPVSSRVNFPELEARVLAFWKERDIFRRSVAERPEHRLYSFYEGPPTANGTPGIHHVLPRIFKDAFPRFWTMRGYRVPRKGGWDTQGLPVELEVEKELGLRSKPDIEAYGVEEFNRRCRESVFRYVEDFERLTDRIGFWVDMEDAYVTYATGYIESCWWILKSLWDHGLVFQDYRSTPHCPRCGTSLSSHELAQGYHEDTPDPSVYVKFHVEGTGDREQGTGPARELPEALRGGHVYLLAWTTTPWTLPGNTALAVDADANYLVVETPREGDAERLVVAAALLDAVVPGEKRVVATIKGADLVGLRYEPLYEPAEWGVDVRGFVDGALQRFGSAAAAPPRRVLATDFVTMEDGTGIVHIAPAFGGEDYETGKNQGLRFILHVDLRGDLMGTGPFSGMFVKDADEQIIDDLRKRGLLWRSGTIRHTYPFCWRCDTPLLYIAKPSWYIRTSALKDRLLANNERINWYPEHIKAGRFGDWLANNVDWAVSRERYWGTPLPIWVCASCGAASCVGSVAEMVERAVDRAAAACLDDLHRPYVDAVELRCQACGGAQRRVPEVADAWFDSGAMPYAQWHYPFENQELFKERFPADFICEAIDQTRGWFYTLHAEATLLNAAEAVPQGIAFKNCVVLGHVLDKNGEKMSKSRGNAVDPWDILNQYGADPLRWYMYTGSPFGQPRRFNPDQVGETQRRFFMTLWNTYSFLVTYANIDGWSPAMEQGTGNREQAEPTELDRWVLSELNLTVRRVTREMEGYNTTDAGRAVGDFVENLSNWYVRRSRRRFWKTRADADKLRAYRTLHTCLVTVTKLMAPLAPFTAEALWQNLVRSWDASAPESVHLADWPEVDEALIDERLSADTQLIMRLASLGRAARARARLKVRQPLPEVLASTRTAAEGEAVTRLADQLREELNVKQVRLAAAESELVDYDVKPNIPALRERGLQRSIGQLQAALKTLDPGGVAAAVRSGRTVEVDGQSFEPGDFLVTAKERPGYAVAQEAGYTVALDTTVTPELADEGLARELVHRLQTMRKDAGFEIADRIITSYDGDADVARVIERHGGYIAGETLSVRLVAGAAPDGAFAQRHDVDGHAVTLAVRRT